jgi:aryl-alcohol dehydrogenase-like predicted oxidoreductase
MSRALDLAVTAWSPLGMGVLTGKYADGPASRSDARLHVDPGGRDLLTPRNLEIAREVGRVAEEIGASPAQVAIAWLRARPGVVVPIVGARREAQLRDNLGALGVALSADQQARLDAVSNVDLGFPSEFIHTQLAGTFVLGDTGSRIDDHRAMRSGRPLAR